MGRVQRAALNYLRADTRAIPDDGVPIHDVTCAVYQTSEPTDAERAAVRRAVAGLVSAGLAGTWRRSYRDRMGDDNRHYQQQRTRRDGTSTACRVAVAEAHVYLHPDHFVVIGCGQAKQAEACSANDMYTGQHFRACLATARAIVPLLSVRILSARYGLLRLDDWIEPYDLTIGQPGAVDAETVAKQLARHGMAGKRVTALCGEAYADLLRQAGAEIETPLAGLGIGQQRHMLAEMRNGQRPRPGSRGR
jgi:hypothetical protein